MWSSHTMEFNGIIQQFKKKKNTVLIPAAMWMNLEGTVLREIIETQKGKDCLIPLLRCTQNVVAIV